MPLLLLLLAYFLFGLLLVLTQLNFDFMSPEEKKLELKRIVKNKFDVMNAVHDKLTSNTGTYGRTKQYRDYQAAKKEYEKAKSEYDNSD
jgi:hypothetical protein